MSSDSRLNFEVRVTRVWTLHWWASLSLFLVKLWCKGQHNPCPHRAYVLIHFVNYKRKMVVFLFHGVVRIKWVNLHKAFSAALSHRLLWNVVYTRIPPQCQVLVSERDGPPLHSVGHRQWVTHGAWEGEHTGRYENSVPWLEQEALQEEGSVSSVKCSGRA